jgi:hypothetical protein
LLVFLAFVPDDVVCDVLSDVGPLRSVILFDLRNECGYEYEAKKKKKKVVCARERTMSIE